METANQDRSLLFGLKTFICDLCEDLVNYLALGYGKD